MEDNIMIIPEISSPGKNCTKNLITEISVKNPEAKSPRVSLIIM
jgi:hypothetical protein